jgi:hypothetical protein
LLSAQGGVWDERSVRRVLPDASWTILTARKVYRSIVYFLGVVEA